MADITDALLDDLAAKAEASLAGNPFPPHLIITAISADVVAALVADVRAL